MFNGVERGLKISRALVLLDPSTYSDINGSVHGWAAAGCTVMVPVMPACGSHW